MGTHFERLSFFFQLPGDIFSRGHATLEAAMSVGRSVRNIFDFRGFPLLPTRPRLRGSVYGLVMNEASGISRNS